MNSNLAKVGKLTRWPPGQSGNPAGKPPGTRTAFSQGFIRDFALVWAEEGLEAVRKVAKKSPEAFVAIAARICPNDVRLTLEQANAQESTQRNRQITIRFWVNSVGAWLESHYWIIVCSRYPFHSDS